MKHTRVCISEMRICLKALNMGKMQVRQADFVCSTVLGKHGKGTLVRKGQEWQKDDGVTCKAEHGRYGCAKDLKGKG